jgi:hypothetical protein
MLPGDKFDRETLEALEKIYEQAISRLPDTEKTSKRKALIANTVETLALAQSNPERLRTATLRMVGKRRVAARHRQRRWTT